jgi:hypothetical protein
LNSPTFWLIHFSVCTFSLYPCYFESLLAACFSWVLLVILIEQSYTFDDAEFAFSVLWFLTSASGGALGPPCICSTSAAPKKLHFCWVIVGMHFQIQFVFAYSQHCF